LRQALTQVLLVHQHLQHLQKEGQP
jgi:hypothetical protein